VNTIAGRGTPTSNNDPNGQKFVHKATIVAMTTFQLQLTKVCTNPTNSVAYRSIIPATKTLLINASTKQLLVIS